jgi:Rieske Fe-S protein
MLKNGVTLLCAIFLIVGVSCCNDVKRRPYGYLRLGPVRDFLAPETYLTDKNLLIRRDAGGLSIMSTLCTHDLTPLKRQSKDGVVTFANVYSSSVYSGDGKVIRGPASVGLPYYSLSIDGALREGPKDTLYVEIGKEKDPTWRLPIAIENG